MWAEIVRLLSDFENAVLTGLDAEGYPYSVRCRPRADATGQVLRVPLPAYAPVQAGPASLLCHRHDENLWNLRSFLVRGILRREEGGWALEPRGFVPGAGVEGAMGMVRFVSGSRRNAERYLKKRGLARPSIPWNRINEIKAQAQESERPPAFLRTNGEASSISRDAKTIKRHRNPLGIFARVLVYPLIGVGAWRHRLELVVAGVALEALLWTAVPPVEETFGFLEDAIETELDWLNAPAGSQKSLSFALLALFPVVLFAGLWRHSRRLLVASASLIVVFYFLMHRVGAKARP